MTEDWDITLGACLIVVVYVSACLIWWPGFFWIGIVTAQITWGVIAGIRAGH
jgi:hypothetical protein